MTSERGPFLRDNAFLVAAVALPVLVAGFFVLANAIPRWTVADPEYDLVLRAVRYYDAPPARLAVDYAVRDGRVEASVRPAAPNAYVQPWSLFLFDHTTMAVREVPVTLPDSLAEGESRTIVVQALAGRHVSDASTAPDGYQLTTRNGGGGGLVGDIFGMGRYRQRVGLEKGGRVIPIEMPAPFETSYASTIVTVGWIVDPNSR
jgi:hypothetical protein